MPRHKDTEWALPEHGNGKFIGYDGAQLAVMMDIRDELKKLNRVFECYNFVRIPRILDRISANTTRKTRKSKSAT